MRIATLVLAIALQAPTPSPFQKAFEAGQFPDVIRTAEGSEEPGALYLAGFAYEELGQPMEARKAYDRLAARGEQDPWRHIGRSASALVTETPTAQALSAANEEAQRAVRLAPGLAEAHYQLGRVYALQQQYERAAAAFDAAIEADRYFAYAYYFAGMSYRQIRQIDQMAIRFESFMKLAPEAPERPRVEAMMRTIRGR